MGLERRPELRQSLSRARSSCHAGFDGATEEEISDAIEAANRNLINWNHKKYGDLARDEFVPQLSRTGKTWLFDGRTGEKFREPITVGQTLLS